MKPLQPEQVFYSACAAATLFVVVGIFYLDGVVLSSRPHDQEAAVFFVLATVTAYIAYVMRPWAART